MPSSAVALEEAEAPHGAIERNELAMTVSEAHRLRQLEDENRKLKKLLDEAMIDNAALKGADLA